MNTKVLHWSQNLLSELCFKIKIHHSMKSHWKFFFLTDKLTFYKSCITEQYKDPELIKEACFRDS